MVLKLAAGFVLCHVMMLSVVLMRAVVVGLHDASPIWPRCGWKLICIHTSCQIAMFLYYVLIHLKKIMQAYGQFLGHVI